MQNSQMELANPFLKFLDLEAKLDRVIEALEAPGTAEKLDKVFEELTTMRRIIDESESVWCTANEAAEILRCTKWNIYRKVELGHLHSKKVGGKVLVYKPDLVH